MVEFYDVEKNEIDIKIIRLGIKIKDIREKTPNLSQEKLALEVDLSENQIRRIEKGQTNPTIKSLIKIANALKVNVKDLFD